MDFIVIKNPRVGSYDHPPWCSPSGPACGRFDSLPANRSILSLGTNQFRKTKAFCFQFLCHSVHFRYTCTGSYRGDHHHENTLEHLEGDHSRTRPAAGKSADTVRRALALLSHRFTLAIKGWRLGLDYIPVANKRKPASARGAATAAWAPTRKRPCSRPAAVESAGACIVRAAAFLPLGHVVARRTPLASARVMRRRGRGPQSVPDMLPIVGSRKVG